MQDHKNFPGPEYNLGYRQLVAWQASMELMLAIYNLTRSWPKEERYGLTAQIRAAATSVPSNIAEGYGRVHRGEYCHHVSIARGSAFEVESQLIAGVRLGYSTPIEADEAWKLTQRTCALVHKLLESLREKQ